MRPLRYLPLLLPAVMLLAGDLSAQIMTITEVAPKKAARGDQITIFGKGLCVYWTTKEKGRDSLGREVEKEVPHINKPTVRIGGEHATILIVKPAAQTGSAFDEVYVLVPLSESLGVGEQPIEVELDGRKKKADVNLIVLASKDSEQENVKEGEQTFTLQEKLTMEIKQGSRRMKPGDQGPDGRPPELTLSRGELKFTVSGESDLPAGCTVSISMSFFRHRFVEVQASLEAVPGRPKTRYSVEINGLKKPFIPGSYEVEVEFLLLNQPPDAIMAFQRKFTKEKDQREYNTIKAEMLVSIGANDDQLLKAIVDHYITTTDKVDEMLAELQTQYLPATQTFPEFRNPDGSLDAEKWTTWLNNRKLNRLPKAEREARIEELKRTNRFLTGPDSRYLDQTKWRDWLDAVFRTQVEQLYKAHRTHKERFIALRFPKAAENLERMIGGLYRLSMDYSADLYRQNGLPVDKRDRQVTGDRIQLPASVTDSYFERMGRKVRREIQQAAVPE